MGVVGTSTTVADEDDEAVVAKRIGDKLRFGVKDRGTADA